MNNEIKELDNHIKQLHIDFPKTNEGFADGLYRLGYRKQKPHIVPVGNGCEVHSETLAQYDSFIKDVAKEAVKAFAEKVKALIDERKFKGGFSANMLWADTAQGCVDELAKEYGAEVVE